MAFNAKGFTGTVDDVEYSKIIGANGEHGVTSEYLSAGLQATSVSGVRQMLIQAGTLAAPGVRGELTTATVTPTADPIPGGSNSRIDLAVATFNWSAKTVTLNILEGAVSATPVPPAPIQNPGVRFDIPLAQGLLTPTSSGAYATVNIKDRRYWVEGGKYVLPSTTQLPGGIPGAIAIRPDTHQMLVCNGPSWDTYKAESDTGWEVVAPPYGGFTGSTWGRIVNGIATITFPWTKVGAAVTNQDLTRELPFRYWPSFDVTGTLYAHAPKAPVLLTMTGGSGLIKLEGVTMQAGSGLRGSVSYPVG